MPPNADPNEANATMMAAAGPSNDSTADGLLTIGARDSGIRRRAAGARERWESEGGAIDAPVQVDVGPRADGSANIFLVPSRVEDLTGKGPRSAMVRPEVFSERSECVVKSFPACRALGVALRVADRRS